jgi:hypothetical protein
MFDANGNLWTGVNWMPGSQSSVDTSIGGGVAELRPDGSAISPAITGFTGAGIDGVGWGTAVTRQNVWVSSFNGKILVMDLHGHPVAREEDFPFHQKLLGLMGIGAAANGDVWIADGSDNQLLFFPGGRVRDGRIVKVAGLASPFDVVIDSQNRVWVSNSQSDTVVRFPASDPTQVQTYRVGISPRALALDSKNNVWVTSLVSPDFPNLPKVPAGASIMEQFKAFGAVASALESGRVKATGFVSMIRTDGTQPVPNAFGGDSVNLPWGINIDGNDDIWTTNGWMHAVVFMAGSGKNGHPPDTKMGDVLHVFGNGTLQTLTDVSIDAAGNVWAANNWSDVGIATGRIHDLPKSTWGGGTGVTVIYGVAAPVKPPRVGAVQHF